MTNNVLNRTTFSLKELSKGKKYAISEEKIYNE